MPPLRPRHVRSHRGHHLPRYYPPEGSRAEGYLWDFRHGYPHRLVLCPVCAVPGGSGGWSSGFNGAVHVTRVKGVGKVFLVGVHVSSVVGVDGIGVG